MFPKQFQPHFRADIESRMAAIGVTADFIDTRVFHLLRGELRCATNVARACTGMP